MAIKLVIDELVQVPGPLREEYRKGEDGKFHLQLDGVHPDTAKVSEFRNNNIAMRQELEELRPLKAKYEGIDPEAAKAALAKAADASKLEADLAAERKAHAATQLAHTVTTEFLKLGGRSSAVESMADLAAKIFAVEDGKVTTKEFSPTNPAEPLSVGEWLQKQMVEKDYMFLPSRGGSAPPRGAAASTFGARSGKTVLRDPSPQQLGANAAAIAKGDIIIEHS